VSLREISSVCAYPMHFRKALAVALIVGTVLLSINQLDAILSGRATGLTALKIALTYYIVRFCVTNYGILVATHQKAASK
jgi:hypothetical protein